MVPSESKYFQMAKVALEGLRVDFELRFSSLGRPPTDAMLLRYAGYCLDVAFAEAGFVPERYLVVLQSAAPSHSVVKDGDEGRVA